MCLPLGFIASGCPHPPGEHSDVFPREVGDSAGEVDEVVLGTAPDTNGVLAPETDVTDECEAPSDCDDGNACTTDRCDARLCVFSPRVGLCDDGDACTEFDACLGAVCVGTAVDCDDGTSCTTDACDPVDGCVHVNLTGTCDDDNLCTTGDVCVAGACLGTSVTCPANQPCRSFACIPAQGCVATDLDGACDDSDVCTSDDACTRGTCAGVLVSCDDQNPCTDDYCEPEAGCGHRANHAACDDANACTVGDVCALGACTSGTPSGTCCDEANAATQCDDLDACTTDTCVTGGCVHTPLGCSDADPCTADTCNAGACEHAAWPAMPETGLVVADFEDPGALGAWQLASDNADVVWQRDDTWAADGTWSLYLGDLDDHSYDHGATRAEARTTFAVPPEAALLRVSLKADVAETSCVYDALRIRIAGGSWQTVTCGSAERGFEWPLAQMAEGQEITVELVFETIDDRDNAGGGLWLDAWTLVPAPGRTCP